MPDIAALKDLSRDQIIDKLSAQLTQIRKVESNDPIGEKTRLVEDLGITSLGLVDLVIMVEESFGVRVKSSQDLTSIKTVGQVVDLLVQEGQKES
ncbi:MAG: acyl carrier protein [Planctomycetota bacterium]|nr:MAG: acyl carrier protein [Planctomycetota bacterium]